MAIRIEELRSAATRYVATVKTLNEARIKGRRTVFLCHSHKDKELVKGVEALLNEADMNVYIDWQDTQMPEKPDQITASRIKDRIVAADFFLFLATENSMQSRWCPWEIGYADGKKKLTQILVIPTTNGITTHGSEYLDLYRRIDKSGMGKVGLWRAGSVGAYPTEASL